MGVEEAALAECQERASRILAAKKVNFLPVPDTAYSKRSG
ncbi:hypothetical protein NIES4074_66200 [Cylindrospermum sp. NIES-4074]|nr:hypothetical protein NIES4074_66200 [Cylindrospermum sp. NIES-4074]